ncbi:hypothetical protein T484DRAFT_1802796 [Baffinella frigidus]|nr:hypothetical protein T484DRAFT_1802796 [Cryptophyta sp. CCMP2293]
MITGIRTEVVNSFVIFSTTSGRGASDGEAGEGGPFMSAFTDAMRIPGLSLAEVMIRTRNTLLERSARCQLAEDVSRLTANLWLSAPQENRQDPELDETQERLRTNTRRLTDIFAYAPFPDEQLARMGRRVSGNDEKKRAMLGKGAFAKTYRMQGKASCQVTPLSGD